MFDGTQSYPFDYAQDKPLDLFPLVQDKSFDSLRSLRVGMSQVKEKGVNFEPQVKNFKRQLPEQ